MKYKLYTISVLAIIILFFVSCSVFKTSKSNQLLFELETTSCYGTCPVYKLQVFDNGEAILEGKQHVDKIGIYRSKISDEKLKELIESFDNVSFFDLQDSYRSQFTDLPTKYITYYKDGKSKQVMAYDNIPKKLKVLIKDLEQLVKEQDWEK